MRVVGGSLRGRRIEPPRGDATRPTTDRVREALFSSIDARAGEMLSGGVALDAFAGSGALGIEALSRGAGHAVFVERDARALRALRANLAALGLESRSTVLQGDALTRLRTRSGAPFSLILLDPPYTLDPAYTRSLLDALRDRGALVPGAFVTWEHAERTHVEWPAGFVGVTGKRYGSTTIDMASYTRGEGER